MQQWNCESDLEGTHSVACASGSRSGQVFTLALPNGLIWGEDRCLVSTAERMSRRRDPMGEELVESALSVADWAIGQFRRQSTTQIEQVEMLMLTLIATLRGSSSAAHGTPKATLWLNHCWQHYPTSTKGRTFQILLITFIGSFQKSSSSLA